MEKYSGKKINTFQERFAELCESNPANDTALANALHVSKQTISAWRNGTRSPRQPLVIDIANHFRVSVSWLMGFDVKKELTPHEMVDEGFKNLAALYDTEIPITNEARIISGGIDKMPPDRREQALRVLQTIFADYFDGGEKNDT